MAKKSSKRSKRRKSLGKRIGGAFNSLTEGIEKFFKNFSRSIGKTFGFVSSLVVPKSLSKKVDKATKSTGKKVGKRVGKITEQVEKKFTKGASGFFSTFGYVFRIFVPKSLLAWFEKRSKAVSKRLKKFFRRLGKGFATWAENYLPKWMVDFGKAFSKKFRRARRTTSKFTTAWWKSRDFNSLAWALPAFLLVMPLMASLVLAGLYDRTKKQSHYVRVMFDSLEENEIEKANLARRKLVQLGYRNEEMILFNTAIAHATKDPPDYGKSLRGIEASCSATEYRSAQQSLYRRNFANNVRRTRRRRPDSKGPGVKRPNDKRCGGRPGHRTELAGSHNPN